MPIQKQKKPFIQIIQGDCLDKLTEIDSDSIHLIVTDPPYFLDGLDCGWKKGKEDAPKGSGTVGKLPVGMKFDPKQGIALQKFMQEVGQEMIRCLMPGGFCIVFMQPRLVHRLAMGLEESGFEIRDVLAWHYTRCAQSKAFSMNHFVDRMHLSLEQKEKLKCKLQGRKTPQLRPQFELMVLAQKPRIGTFVTNWQSYQTGLIDTNQTLNGRPPSTMMTAEKSPRECYNSHLTVKPVGLISHLIEVFSLPGQVVLDPFLGSGTTAIAALQTARACCGIEINPDYISIAQRRIQDLYCTKKNSGSEKR